MEGRQGLDAEHTPRDEELAALYALGVLGGQELIDFRRHLAGCGRCQELVDQDLETLARLIAAAPEMEAACGAGGRLRGRAERELELEGRDSNGPSD
jgi:hypothetical protein